MSKEDWPARLRDAQDNLDNAESIMLDSSQAFGSITEAKDIINDVIWEMEDEL